MKGRISKYIAEKGFGFLKVKGRSEDVFFHSSQMQKEQHSFIAEGLEVEFDIGIGPNGREQATNLRFLLDEDTAVDDWACILVDEAGNWSSTDADHDRAIAVAFLPSAKTLEEQVGQHGLLLENFHASAIVEDRASQFDQMGQIIQSLIAKQQAAFAVGRIPAHRWPPVASMGDSLWAAMIARLVAVYLPFVRGRAWVAVEDRLVTPGLWNFYRHELRGRLADACHLLNRPDRTQSDTWLRLCIYAKKQGAITHQEGEVTVQEPSAFDLIYRWHPDGTDADPIPITHIRCGISLPDFIGNVIVSGTNPDAQRWREKLQGKVHKVDLTKFRL